MNSTTRIIINEINNLLENKTIKNLINLETDNIYNKSAVPMIVKKYIDNNSIYGIDLMKDYNLVVKFISVNFNYKSYEAMSFASTSLYNILFEDWNSENVLECSLLRNQLSKKYLFIPILKVKTKGVYNNYSEWKIGELSLWSPNEYELELIGEEWNDVKEIVKEGVKVKVVKFGNSYRKANNLPKQSETRFIHLRPHAKNSFDYDVPYLNHTNGEIEITKQSFWLNKKYINLLLDKYKWKTTLKEE